MTKAEKTFEKLAEESNMPSAQSIGAGALGAGSIVAGSKARKAKDLAFYNRTRGYGGEVGSFLGHAAGRRGGKKLGLSIPARMGTTLAHGLFPFNIPIIESIARPLSKKSKRLGKASAILGAGALGTALYPSDNN